MRLLNPGFLFNAALVVFGILAAAFSTTLTGLAIVCGALASVATGAALVWTAWLTFLNTPYQTWYLDTVRPSRPIVLTPRRGMPDKTKASFWKWFGHWVVGKPYAGVPTAHRADAQEEEEKAPVQQLSYLEQQNKLD